MGGVSENEFRHHATEREHPDFTTGYVGTMCGQPRQLRWRGPRQPLMLDALETFLDPRMHVSGRNSESVTGYHGHRGYRRDLEADIGIGGARS